MNKSVFHSIIYLFSFILLFIAGNMPAQVQYGGTPVSFSEKMPSESVETIIVSLNEDMEQRKHDVYVDPQIGEAMHAGFSLPADVSPHNYGTWEQVGDTLKIWRLNIHSPDAIALGLAFDEFYLPENYRMFVYSGDKQFIVGAFDHRNNNEDNIFVTHIVPGETIIVELEEKIEKGSTKNDDRLLFNISEIVHVSDGGGLFAKTGKDLGDSGPCQVNINCPEGDDWQMHKRSIARMLMRVGDSYYWCTGALVNNTAGDGKPYFLSADHCGQAASSADMVYWHFYFNFERPGCEDEGTPVYNMLHGCALKSKGQLDGGSDFKLLLLREPPPASWQPYYSGWNISGEQSPSGVGIHHPAGDAKKITTYNQQLSSATPSIIIDDNNDSDTVSMAQNSAWRVYWKETETNWGVPERGSSGSPLFNEQGLIIGTLTGGSSSCEEPEKPDFYGKMSYHWESNDTGDQKKQLKPYLDPMNYGVTELQGMDPYYEKYPPPGFLTANKSNNENIELKWYKPGSTPNPTGWFSHIVDFSHLTWERQERAVLFDAKDFDFTFPVTLEKVSHLFAEHQDYLWPDDKFSFRIYDAYGKTLIYESPQLIAEHMQEAVYTLNEPLVIDEKFYVAVKTFDGSGHPSTLMKRVNYGTGNSFIGSSDDWTPYIDFQDNMQFDFLTRIYISGYDKSFSSIEVNGFKPDSDKKHITEIEFDSYEDVALKENYENFVDNMDLPDFYRLYRDNNLIYQTEETGEVTYSYIDEAPGYGFFRYHVSGVYDGTIESEPSNIAYVLNEEPCLYYIDEFPFTEVFEGAELDDCWKIIEQSVDSWQFTAGYSQDGIDVDPVEGSHFVYVPWTDVEPQDEWLITAPIDFSALSRPAVRFWFNGSYTWSTLEDNCNLKVYISVNDGAFHKVWDHSMHPEFDSPEVDYLWLQALVDLEKYSDSDHVRIAFQYEGQSGANFAIDKIEIIEASGLVSEVVLRLEPEFSGTVKGGGIYVAGEPVKIIAEPNIGYGFEDWKLNNEVFSEEAELTFIMPSDNIDLTAWFAELEHDEDDDNDEEKPTEKILGYPNPAETEYFIEFYESMDNVSIAFYNIQGARVEFYSFGNVAAGNILNFYVEGLAQGLYLIMIDSDDYRRTLKVSIVN